MITMLRDVCHARAGDKGATVNIGLACYDPADYPWIVEHVTTERVLQHSAIGEPTAIDDLAAAVLNRPGQAENGLFDRHAFRAPA